MRTLSATATLQDAIYLAIFITIIFIILQIVEHKGLKNATKHHKKNIKTKTQTYKTKFNKLKKAIKN